MKSTEIRETFLKFFEKHAHHRVKSSSLIPAADPTLLFTNAGMVQFKDCFLGHSDLGFHRATSCQKCVRAGGKHNDLENVGFTPRHHTFFEMLGNFSFGDYFKKDAIAFAWELLTVHYKIPKDRLQITVFEKDDEAFDLWKAQGVPEVWITRLGEKDNFWAMGDTGPCGPCTEIHYDWGKDKGCLRPECNPGCSCGRFLEIWNLVFMQFNRDSQGNMIPLPKPSVDTGAGLERLACVLQGVFSNYDTDIFAPVLNAISRKVGKAYGAVESETQSMRVIADHMRSGTFLLSDGVIPSNEGRGYVLRRILRRAIRHGKKLGQDKPFLHELVASVTGSLSSVYPDVEKNRSMIETMMKEEEVRFHETLHRGIGLLEETIRKITLEGKKQIPGDIAFKLYDTFGFPFDLIEVIAQEHKLTVDEKGFQAGMEKQRSQSVWNKGDEAGFLEAIGKTLSSRKWETKFHGYSLLNAKGNVLALFTKDGAEVNRLEAGSAGFAVFDESPFYAEGGGQSGDKGLIHGTTKTSVQGTFKIGKTFLHRVAVEEGNLEKEKTYQLSVEPRTRKSTAINHTATHMLHAALRQVLGERVKQAGSLVEPGRLRFDFTYPRPVTDTEVAEIESIVNEQIKIDPEVKVEEMAYDDAIKSGALAFFDEKYGDKVRVVRVGGKEKPFSVELCGGTHLERIADIGLFKVLSESSVASGVRRIEAITSDLALRHLLEREKLLGTVESRLGTRSEGILKKIDQLLENGKRLEKENEKLQLSVAMSGGTKGAQNGGGNAIWEKKIQIKDIQLVMDKLPSMNPKLLRDVVDQVRDKLKEKTVVVLASESEGKAFLCIGLTKDLVGRWDAAKLIRPLAEEVGGTGGGRGDFAQAGGSNPSGLSKAFEKFEAWVRENA